MACFYGLSIAKELRGFARDFREARACNDRFDVWQRLLRPLEATLFKAEQADLFHELILAPLRATRAKNPSARITDVVICDPWNFTIGNPNGCIAGGRVRIAFSGEIGNILFPISEAERQIKPGTPEFDCFRESKLRLVAFEIVGMYAASCDLLAEWIENQPVPLAEEDNFKLQENCPGAVNVGDGAALSSWLPDDLSPSPQQLSDLRERLNQLADAIGSYERNLVGKPIRLIVNGGYEYYAFLTLLRRIKEVGDWDAGDDCMGEGMGSLFIDWCGWPDDGGWADWVRDIFLEVVCNLNKSGVPVLPDGSVVGLVFDDVCFREPEWRKDIDGVNHEKKTPTGIAAIPNDAVFLTLHPPDSPSISRSVKDGCPQSLQDYLYYYADQILITLNMLQCRTIESGRTFKIDLRRVFQFALRDDCEPQAGYYPAELLESDPFAAAEELEGLTGVRIAHNEDPVWFLSQHKQYKKATLTFAEHSTFAEYMQRRFPDRLFDPDDPLGLIRAEKKQEEWDFADFEGELPDDELPKNSLPASENAKNEYTLEDEGLVLRCNREVYNLTAAQASIVKILFEAWEAGRPSVNQDVIREKAYGAIDAGPQHLREPFRSTGAKGIRGIDRMAKVWREVIIKGERKNTLRLK